MNDFVFSADKRKLDLGTVTLNKLKSQEFDEVVVRGETKLMESSIDKRVYNVDEDMTSIGGGLTEVLNNIPSVEVDHDGNVSLRGRGSVTILIDRKSTRLNSSHVRISYAVFCLKKRKNK